MIRLTARPLALAAALALSPLHAPAAQPVVPAAEQGREQRRRFLTPGSGYQPGNAQMFNNGNN